MLAFTRTPPRPSQLQRRPRKRPSAEALPCVPIRVARWPLRWRRAAKGGCGAAPALRAGSALPRSAGAPRVRVGGTPRPWERSGRGHGCSRSLCGTAPGNARWLRRAGPAVRGELGAGWAAGGRFGQGTAAEARPGRLARVWWQRPEGGLGCVEAGGVWAGG